ncbi:MAG: rRNA maturation RNase YbeY [Rubricoccaceae bacterium]|nr:rRNA maturation RNase YbeY [Rubricoccaceae bacterium]
MGAAPRAEDDGPVTVHQAHPSRRLDEAAVRAAVARVLDGEGSTAADLSVVLADHATVRALHRDWLGRDVDTDVVSFPLDDDAPARRVVDGEVYVDLDTAAERAPEFGGSFEAEALRYVVHGLLHLLGYDDATDAERAEMRRLEDRYLRAGEREPDAR